MTDFSDKDLFDILRAETQDEGVDAVLRDLVKVHARAAQDLANLYCMLKVAGFEQGAAFELTKIYYESALRRPAHLSLPGILALLGHAGEEKPVGQA